MGLVVLARQSAPSAPSVVPGGALELLMNKRETIFA